MELSTQNIKSNLVFPEVDEIPAEIINLLKQADVEIKEFTSNQKTIIKEYIDYLYPSDTAKEIFSQMQEVIHIIPTTEFLGGKDFGTIENPLRYPLVSFDVDIFNGEKLGYISKSGEFVEYAPELIFMHELIHAITGQFDGDHIDNVVVDNTVDPPIVAPRIVRLFISPEDSLGPTQRVANQIHKELGVPIRVSYDGTGFINRLNGEEDRNIEVGTQFTKGKIVDSPNSELDIAAFVSSVTFDNNGLLTTNSISTNSRTQTTSDLFILKKAPGADRATRIVLQTGAGNDYLYGNDADDQLIAGKDNDYLYGGAGNDELRGDDYNGGTGIDTAEYSDIFENYNIETDENNTRLTTITHEEMSDDVEIDDGTDDLYDIEWGIFKGEDLQPLAAIPSSSEDGTETQAMVASATASAPRVIPLPLTDGVETTETVKVDGVEQPPYYDPTLKSPHVSLTAPVAMLDGDVDFTLNISPFEQNSEYNVVYIFDRSSSTNSSAALQTTKDAYTDLTNYFIDTDIAENINFSLVSFSRYATIQENLSADEIITAIENTTSETQNVGTAYRDALTKADRFFADSALNRDNTTNLAYFVSDGRSYPNGFNYNDPIPSYHTKATDLQEFAYVQAFGLDIPLNDGRANDNPAVASQINYVDSNGGVIVTEASELTTEIGQSGLAGDVQEINILVDGEIVDTIQPSQLTDSPFGLTYEGSVDELNVSIDAENVVTTEVVFNNGLPATSIEHTVTAGEGEAVDGDGNDIAQSNDDNEDPFEKMLDGGDRNDEITLGYADLGANGGAGGDEIIGNERNNVLDGGAGNDTISAYGGDDSITTGAGTDKVNGGEGIDTAVYNDVAYGDGSAVSLRKAANSVSYNNTDTLTDVEFIEFSDVRVSAETLEVTPIVEVGGLSVREGNSANTLAELEFNLSTPAPADVTFDYSTEDLNATAGEDYVAESGQINIPAGQTTASLNLEIIGDKEYEEFEQFALNFSNLSGATFANNRSDDAVGVTIENDDVLPLNLVGDGEDNYLAGEDGNDTLDGAGGNDTLVGNAGNDKLTGGTGNDTIVEAGNTDFTLTDTTLSGRGNDTISQIESVELTGGEGNNTFIARDVTQMNVTLDGLGGNDNLVGGVKNDSLIGGAGSDRLAGKNGNDKLEGGQGFDTLYGDVGNDSLSGGEGNDSLLASNGNDTLQGEAGNDTLDGGAGFDRLVEAVNFDLTLTDTTLTGRGRDTISNFEQSRLTGGVSNNVLNAGTVTALNVTLDGAAGNDALYGGAKSDVLVGRDGNDRLESRKGNDALYGEKGNDALYGGDGNDRLFGNADNDTLKGEAGNDTLNGGGGSDLLVETANVNFTLTDTTLTGRGSDTIAEIELARLEGGAGNNTLNASAVTAMNVTLVGAAGNDSLDGGTKSDILYGQNGNDRIEGRQGYDALHGGNGNDALYGGDGNDRIWGNNNNDTLQGQAGNDTLNGGAGFDQLRENANVNFTLTDTRLTGRGRDTLSNIEAARLTGGVSNNVLNAGRVTALNVTLDGALGNDTLYGGAKSDVLVGREGSDRLEGRKGYDALYGSLGNDALYGGDGDDRLLGNQDNDTLKGEAGNDTIYGGGGTDRLVETGNVNFTLTDTTLTGRGSDTIAEIELARLEGGAGNNTLDAELVTTMNVTLDGALGNDTLYGGAKSDVLLGREGNDLLAGRDGDDILNGSMGSDRLYGELGNDTLNGGAGNDTLNGGQGADTLVLDLVSGTDTIRGFNRFIDLIGLPASLGFSDLSVSDNNAGTATLIRDTTNGDRLLAIIDGVMANQITADNFTNV